MASEVVSTRLKVLVFPWLAAGHISPFLELAKNLSRNNFHTYFCSTAVNLTSIQNTFKNNSWDYPIEFIELSLPYFSDLPPQFHTTKDLPPHLMPTLNEAFQKSQPNFTQILNNLKPDLLIFDNSQPWAARIASSMNIQCVHLHTTGAAALSFFLNTLLKLSQDTNRRYPFPEIYLNDVEMIKFNAFCKFIEEQDIAFSSFELSTNIVLINCCKEAEGKYLDYVSSLIGKKFVSSGPLIQEANVSESHRHIFEWLDSKTQSSVIFVSFGSEYFLSKEEMEELASGLELSNANFLWAVRISEGNTIEEALPEGFLEKVKNRGMVVEGWVPQTRILQHPSIGGFISHCGWNSVLESLYYGAPVIAIPMNYDQPLNAKLLEAIGVGIEVAKDEHGKLERGNISNVIKKVVIQKDGEVIRGKAKDLSDKLKVEKEVNINGVLQELRNVCQLAKLKQ